MAMVAAAPLARAPQPLTALVLLVYLGLGVASRAAVSDPAVPAESNLRKTAYSLERIERGFKILEPVLPRHARVYVYVQAAGTHGGYDSLYKNQPLKVWYDDPSIVVRDPMNLLPASEDEFLFWISPELGVFEVDPRSLQARSSGPKASFPEYQKTLRAFALGLAGRGETDRAVSVLTGMRQYSGYLRAYDRRSAAAILLAAGRERDAAQILEATPAFHREDAIQEVAGLIAKPVPGIDLDEGALRAFGLAPSDSNAVRSVMKTLERGGYREGAVRFARRLLRLVPEDPEAESLARAEPRT
jgi:hypothetical protein